MNEPKLYTVMYQGKEHTVFAANFLTDRMVQRMIDAATDGVLDRDQMREFCPRLIMGQGQTMELFPALLTAGCKEWPLLSREVAIAEFKALVAQYGFQWTARVPAEAYDRMRRVNDVLNEQDRREAAFGRAK